MFQKHKLGKSLEGNDNVEMHMLGLGMIFIYIQHFLACQIQTSPGQTFSKAVGFFNNFNTI